MPDPVLDERAIEAAAKALAVQAGVPHKDGEPLRLAFDRPHYYVHAEAAVTAYLRALPVEELRARIVVVLPTRGPGNFGRWAPNTLNAQADAVLAALGLMTTEEE